MTGSPLNRRTGSDHPNAMSVCPVPRIRATSTSWLAGAGLLSLLLTVAACNRSPEVSATPTPPAVAVVAAARQRVPVYGQYVGQTEAVKTVEVRARVEGFIEQQAVRDGADVKAGELLFVIDALPFETALRQAQANLDRDLAQLENARTQERRYRTLLQQELIAGEQYDQLRTNLSALQATVQADRAAIDNAKAAFGAAGLPDAPVGGAA
jgi:multidrug efflux system membrane fusion protein